MAWGKSRQDKTQQASLNSSGTSAVKDTADATVIAPTLVVIGELKSEQAMFIEGKVVGNIVSSHQVHVGRSGWVEGNVKCETIRVEGKLKGNVEATANITIEATGHVRGDLVTREFINRPGGFFEGYSHMIEDAHPQKTVEKKQPKDDKEKNRDRGK